MSYTIYNTLKNLQEKERTKNIIALDTELKSKIFYNIPTRKELLKVFETDNHAYEMITKNRPRIYFDIDNLDLTRHETDDLIKCVIDCLNDIYFVRDNGDKFKILLTIDDLAIACNDNTNKYTMKPSDKIHSLHIILPKFSMKKEHQKLLVKYLNKSCDVFEKFKIDEMFDPAVYSKNQQFRFINQSKLSNNIKLINYKNDGVDYKDFQINHTYGCCALQFNQIFISTEITDDKISLQLPREKVIDFILTEPSIDQHKLFNQTRLWALMTRLIIKENNSKDYPEIYDIDEWNKKSCTVSQNPRFTIDRNYEYINSIKHENTIADIFCLYKIINDYSTKYNVYSDLQQIQPHTTQMLMSIYDEEVVREIITNIILYKSKSITNGLFEVKTKISQNTIINLKSGFIVYDDSTKSQNIYCDNMPLKMETVFEEIDNIYEAKYKLEDMINFKSRNIENNETGLIYESDEEYIIEPPPPIIQSNKMILKSRWGTRKTSLIMEYLINHEIYQNKRILLITESNALNSKLQRDYDFISHQDKAYKKVLHNQNRVVCSIQSLWRLSNNCDYDVVIVDEITSILNAYTSTKTFAQLPTDIKTHDIYDLMLKIIRKSGFALLCDADISQEYIKILQRAIDDDNMNIVKNNQLAFHDYKFIIQPNIDKFVLNLTEKLTIQNHKISFASTSKRRIDELIEALNKSNLNKNILTITQDGVILYTNGVMMEKLVDTETMKNKQNVLKSIDEYIIKNKVDLFCYSPTIKTGISFNTVDYFDYTFAIGDCNSIVYPEFLQMLFRVRNLKQKQIFINLDKSQFFNKQNATLTTTINQQTTKHILFQHITKNMGLINKSNCSNEYHELQLQNINIACNSRNNYNANFIQLLKYHNLEYCYELDITIDDLREDLEKNILDRKQELRIIKRDKWLSIPIMRYDLYVDMKSKMSDDVDYYSNMTEEEQSSYSKTLHIFQLRNINDTNYDTDKITQQLLQSNTQYFYDRYFEYDYYKKVYDIRTIFNDEFEYHDPNQADDKDDILMKSYKRLILKMFNYFLNEDFIFTPLTITNAMFKRIITEKDNIVLINEIFKNINSKKTAIMFNADNNSHIKTIYRFIQSTLSKMDIILKYLDHNTDIPSGKMVFNQNKSLVLYKKDKTIIKSNTLSHLKNEAKGCTIEDDEKLLTSKQLLSYSSKIEDGATFSNKFMLKYLKSLLKRDYTIYDLQFKNKLLDMEHINNEIVVHDKSYKIETNLRTKNHFITIKQKRPIIKCNVYKIGNNYKPYYPNPNKKTIIIKDKVNTPRSHETDGFIKTYVNDLLNNIVNNICLKEDMKSASSLITV